MTILRFGKAGGEAYAEGWAFIGPIITRVRNGETVWIEDQKVALRRDNSVIDIYWTFSCSPVFNAVGDIDGALVVCNETTKHVQVQKSLVDSESRFQSLIQEAAIGIIVLEGTDNVVEIANSAYLRLVGKSETEVVGKRLFDVLPEAATYFEDIIDNTRISGEPFYLNEHPYFVMQDDGSRIDGFLNLIYQPRQRGGQQITGVMILCQDVTEQVTAQMKVADSEAQVRAIVDSAPFPIGVYEGREMKIILANESIMEVWDKGSDIIGKTYFDVLPELEDQNIYPELVRVYETGVPYHARNQQVNIIVGGSLQRFYFNYSFTPLRNAKGDIYGVMNTAADVTDIVNSKLKVEQSQENFRNLILQAPVSMCLLLGPDHTVEVANDAMINLWGKPKQDVMDKPIFAALPDAREQGLEEIMDHVYISGETFTASEMPIHLLRFGKQDIVYQNFIYEPYRDGTGKILGVIAISNDVTDQVLARQRIEELVEERTHELTRVNADLQKSNDDLAQFAYIASHDLQEPLRKISVFSKMVAERTGNSIDAKSAEQLGKINGAAARMQALVQDVLAYSQLSSQQEFLPVNLDEVVKSIITDYELKLEQADAEILLGELPLIEAHPLQMTQLFTNLLSNALKFAKEGVNPKIEIFQQDLSDIDLERLPPGSAANYVKIAFKDNGIGFKQEYMEKIFTIFQRLHTKSDYEGTGIGLAICKKIVLNHNGILSAEGHLGVGATFSIILPRIASSK